MDLADPQQWAECSYSNNNPTTYSDATGLLFTECHDGSYSCTVNSEGNISAEKKEGKAVADLGGDDDGGYDPIDEEAAADDGSKRLNGEVQDAKKKKERFTVLWAPALVPP